MEFVDYKCLESLISEGEDMIATEGLGSMIMTLIKGAISLLGKIFTTIANIFRNIYNKLKSKRAVKKDSTEKSNSESKESETKNTPTKVNMSSDEEIRKKGEDLANSVRENPKYKELLKKIGEPKQETKPNTEKDIREGSSLYNDTSAKLVFDKGDKVTKELNYLIDACYTIRNTVFSESEDYKSAVEIIEKHTNLLEENFKDFSDEVNKFKEEFEKNNKCMSAATRDDLCKTAIRRSEDYTSFAERCDKKLKNIFNISRYQKEDVEEGNIDIQKVRAPAQKALSIMNKYATASVKIYNELNNLLVSAVIVD